MSGNDGLSRAEEDVGPPAGGFGAAAPAGDGLVRLPAPKPRTHIGVVVAVAVVAALLAGVYRLGVNELHTAQRLSAKRDLQEVMPYVERSYVERGSLCPSATPLPASVSDLPDSVTVANFTNDLGWRCLGFARSGPMLNQLRYDASDDKHFVLTATSPPDREDLPGSVIVRGHVEVEGKTIEFEPIEERLRK